MFQRQYRIKKIQFEEEQRDFSILQKMDNYKLWKNIILTSRRCSKVSSYFQTFKEVFISLEKLISDLF